MDKANENNVAGYFSKIYAREGINFDLREIELDSHGSDGHGTEYTRIEVSLKDDEVSIHFKAGGKNRTLTFKSDQEIRFNLRNR